MVFLTVPGEFKLLQSCLTKDAFSLCYLEENLQESAR